METKSSFVSIDTSEELNESSKKYSTGDLKESLKVNSSFGGSSSTISLENTDSVNVEEIKVKEEEQESIQNTTPRRIVKKTAEVTKNAIDISELAKNKASALLDDEDSEVTVKSEVKKPEVLEDKKSEVTNSEIPEDKKSEVIDFPGKSHVELKKSVIANSVKQSKVDRVEEVESSRRRVRIKAKTSKAYVTQVFTNLSRASKFNKTYANLVKSYSTRRVLEAGDFMCYVKNKKIMIYDYFGEEDYVELPSKIASGIVCFVDPDIFGKKPIFQKSNKLDNFTIEPEEDTVYCLPVHLKYIPNNFLWKITDVHTLLIGPEVLEVGVKFLEGTNFKRIIFTGKPPKNMEYVLYSSECIIEVDNSYLNQYTKRLRGSSK